MPQDKQTRPSRERRCPICGKPAEPRWQPFCSKRCANVDLGRWLGERYAIPGEPTQAPPGSRSDEED